MNCQDFRAAFAPATDDTAILEHVRSCDPCLDFAAHSDPDVMFRAIGGSDMIPPGGVDAFVDDVMRAVHLRKAEDDLSPRRAPISWTMSWTRKLAVAATIAIGITGGAIVYEHEQTTTPAAPLSTQHSALSTRVLATKPIVETYSSSKATIVEMPAESANDARVVMILDENLPADL
jgi:hypothetical protein